MMLSNKAQGFVEEYLYRARGHRALEQSVLAEGERRGFSERRLLRAAKLLGVSTERGCWELHPLHAASLVQQDLATLTMTPEPLVPVGAGVRRAA